MLTDSNLLFKNIIIQYHPSCSHLQTLIIVHQCLHSPLEHMSIDELIPKMTNQQTIQLILKKQSY